MTDINKTIKELWQKTYRNQDIDYIQVMSRAPCSRHGGRAPRHASLQQPLTPMLSMRRHFFLWQRCQFNNRRMQDRYQYVQITSSDFQSGVVVTLLMVSDAR